MRRIRHLVVKDKHQLTPNMLRIVLGGEELADFPDGQESGYVKLLLSQENKIIKRSYTIRAFDAEKKQLTLDFVVGEKGPATAWVMNCKVGDEIDIDGPGATKLVDHSADWFFLAGDMTALPAISVNLEQLPATASGHAVLEIIDPEDQQQLKVPPGIKIVWVVNPSPYKSNTILVDAVRALPWKDGQPSVWAACEFDAMRSLRRYFKQERQVERGQVYASSYWKIGETDEGNKAAKKLDTEAD